MRDDAPTEVPRSEWDGLAERIRAGDRRAEAEFVNVFQPRLRCILLARTRCVDTARELTQDVIVHALRALRGGQLRDMNALPPFLHGIARNVLAEHWRSTRRNPNVSLQDAADVPQPETDPGDEERATRVRESLALLSTADREILLLYLVEGSQPSQIAARLGLSSEAVRQRKCRAIKRIRDEMKKDKPRL